MHNFHNIPHEMRFYRQWVTWRYEQEEVGKKPTKVLYNPLFNGHASVSSPETWVSYEEAVAAFEDNGDMWAGIGFVLTTDDPYCFIDLDNTDDRPDHKELFDLQNTLYNSFHSYAEWSPSGKGLHIITKGAVERGRKRKQVEIYSQLRFMTMTGNVYRDAPILDEDTTVKMWWHQMGGAAAVNSREANYQPQTEEDARVLHRMYTAENGALARNLYDGHWQQHYGSWSEADQALFNILVFYTKNKEQIVRMFQASGLASRRKAFRVDYLERTLSLAFDRELPPVDIEALHILLNDIRAETNGAAPAVPSAAPNITSGASYPELGRPQGDVIDASNNGQMGHNSGPVNSSIPMPPGLVGEIAEFIYSAAPRPVAEIALVGALGFMAGMTARSFNVRGTGLNIYMLMLAPTGTGKEAMNSGISKLASAMVKAGSPNIYKFIGPGHVASKAALHRWLDDTSSCFLSILGEFGITLKSMSDPRASQHLKDLKSALMDVYTKSGAGQRLNETARAKAEDSTKGVLSPNFSFIGESTQERFFEAVDETMIYEGLLPRCTLVEYNGDLPTLNNRAHLAQPSTALLERLGKLVSWVNARDIVTQGPLDVDASNEAAQHFDKFNTYCESFQRGPGSNELLRGVWTRAHLKAMKLAAIVAIGINNDRPVIDLGTAEWACMLTARECQSLLARFDANQVGETVRTDDRAQHDTVVRLFKKWLLGTAEIPMKYGVSSAMHFQGWLPHAPLIRALASQAAFKRANNPSIAANAAIKLMLDNDEIRLLPTQQTIDTLGTQAKCYVVSDPSTFFRD